MTNLHAHYHHGSVKAFRQELDGTSPAQQSAPAGGGSASASASRGIGPSSASGGARSWTLTAAHAPVKADPNARDAFGRTVLHLAASGTTPQAYSFFTILLRNPHIAVNLQDYESGYTALHRALYAGNLRAARDLLARADTDMSVLDAEGLTAFDLYNSTVDGTNPRGGEEDGTDLYVWGVNSNYALGTGDAGDRAWPNRVQLLTQRQASDHPDLAQRFYHVGVRDIAMAKLHTGVITTERRGNLSLCGFGSQGRLGRSVHSQLALLPLPDLPHTVTALALGQNHTLALTSGGFILSWGSNQFAQLGYASEGADEFQVSPKRVVGPLKKEWIRGVAAGRMASACWTADAVWTWGTNLGHLGYEKAANPVQVNPRRVPAITQPIIDIALSDYAMLCLLDSFEVVCFHHDTHFKINFSSPRSLKPHLGQVTLDPTIVKVTSCGQTFATLSRKGDVCTFQLPHPSEEAGVRDRHVTVKPQVQWALRKSFTAVRDMALGGDGTIIICTYSGHVFVRQRLKAGGQLKFRRIPYLQRVIKVAANESGAFAAVRVDARPSPIALAGKTLEEDMFLLQPHFRRFESQMNAEDFANKNGAAKEDEDEEESNSVARDSQVALAMCGIVDRWQATSRESLFAWGEALLGSDLHVVVGDYAIPAHTVILSLRSSVLARALAGKPVEGFSLAGDALTMAACHPLVALLLLQYLYSDDVAAIWDSRVSHLLMTRFSHLKLPIGDIKADLRRYAEHLQLAPLAHVLDMSSKTPITKSLGGDLAAFHAATASRTGGNTPCDTVIVLADREVTAHSTLLRARCPFFESFFGDRDWTLERKENSMVTIQMAHLRWRPMRLVFRYMHEGSEEDLFDYLHQETLDEFLDFVFEVLAAATELLMDRLVLVCSEVIARHCNPYNAAALAAEASFYQAAVLKQSIFDYIAASMETMLESGLLDDMDDDVLRDLSTCITAKQSDRAVVPRSGILVAELMAKHRDWLALQDIPVPRVRGPQRKPLRSPLVGPKSPLLTPDFRPLSGAAAGTDEIFPMDLDSPTPAPAMVTPPPPKVWKAKNVQSEKVDLRNIIAETAAARGSPRAPGGSPSLRPVAGSPSLGPAGGSPGPSGSGTTSVSAASGSAGWRTVEQRKTSLSAVQAQQSGSQQASSPVHVSVLNRPAGSQASPAPQRTGAAKVITPVRLQTTPRSNSGPAWATPTTYAPPLPPPSAPVLAAPRASPGVNASASSPPPPTQAFSLLAIQAEERAAAARASQRSVKSFAEIQAEERAAQAARAQEEEFMRWWQEEEARLAGGGAGGGNASRGRGRGGQQKRASRGGRGGRSGGAGERRENGEKTTESRPPPANGKAQGGGNGDGGANGGARDKDRTANGATSRNTNLNNAGGGTSGNTNSSTNCRGGGSGGGAKEPGSGKSRGSRGSNGRGRGGKAKESSTAGQTQGQGQGQQ